MMNERENTAMKRFCGEDSIFLWSERSRSGLCYGVMVKGVPVIFDPDDTRAVKEIFGTTFSKAYTLDKNVQEFIDTLDGAGTMHRYNTELGYLYETEFYR